MKIKIENGTAIGLIKVKWMFLNGLKKDIIYYPEKPLYDFHVIVWGDFDTDTVLIKMWGSIVSMMQYRKYLLMNWPQLDSHRTRPFIFSSERDVQ